MSNTFNETRLYAENDALREKIVELEAKLVIARSFIPVKDLVSYSMKLDEIKGGDL